MDNKNDRKTTSDHPEALERAPQREPDRADGTAAGTIPSDPQELASAYQKLLQEKQEFYDRLLRKQAELENVRKRLQREKEEFLQHATADLVRALLPTLDG